MYTCSEKKRENNYVKSFIGGRNGRGEGGFQMPFLNLIICHFLIVLIIVSLSPSIFL